MGCTQRFAIQIAYQGTDFCGWQIQRGVGRHANPKPSIEETIVSAIEKQVELEEPIHLVSSGRTDAGVHASGHVAHFDLKESPLSPENFLLGINHHLPPSIRIQRLTPVPNSFRAQHSIRKQYSYYFQQGPNHLPHLREFTMWDRYPLDADRMHEAIRYLCGEHDFMAFGSSGGEVQSTVRTISEAVVTREPISLPGYFCESDAHQVRVKVIGSGFLKQMMRSIAGTLKQIGESRRDPIEMQHILESKDRQLVGPTAPANGLWLEHVWYTEEIFSKCDQASDS